MSHLSKVVGCMVGVGRGDLGGVLCVGDGCWLGLGESWGGLGGRA